MNRNSLDDLIKKAIQIEAQNKNDVDMDIAWKNFERKYYKRNSLPKARIFLYASCIFPSLLVAVNVIYPVEVQAISLKTANFIKSFFTGKVNIIGIDYEDKYTFGMEDKNIEKLFEPQLLDKINTLPYEILLPMDYLGSYKITSFDIHELGESFDVRITLAGNENKQINIRQININTGFSQGLSIDNEDTTQKEVRINGQAATLINYKNQEMLLNWLENGIFISISGKVSEEEILSIGTSMKRFKN